MKESPTYREYCNLVRVVPDDTGTRYRAVCAGCPWRSPWWPPTIQAWADVWLTRDALARAKASAVAHIRQRATTRRR